MQRPTYPVETEDAGGGSEHQRVRHIPCGCSLFIENDYNRKTPIPLTNAKLLICFRQVKALCFPRNAHPQFSLQISQRPWPSQQSNCYLEGASEWRNRKHHLAELHDRRRSAATFRPGAEGTFVPQANWFVPRCAVTSASEEKGPDKKPASRSSSVTFLSASASSLVELRGLARRAALRSECRISQSDCRELCQPNPSFKTVRLGSGTHKMSTLTD